MLTYPCSYEGHLRVGYAVVLPGDDGALAVAQKLREFSLRHFHPGSRILEILAGYRPVDQAFLSWLVRRFMIVSGPSGSLPVRSLLAPGCSSPSRPSPAAVGCADCRLAWPLDQDERRIVGRLLQYDGDLVGAGDVAAG